MLAHCAIAGCDRPVSGRGWCNLHYQRWYRGQPLGGPEQRQYATPAEALRARTIVLENGCHLWQGSIGAGGYGSIGTGGRIRRAHRVAWELVNGPVPAGLQLDHLCRNRACVNPSHLEPVTQAENVRRGTVSERNWNRGKPACRHGHPFSEANTYTASDGKRACKACHRATERRRYRRINGLPGPGVERRLEKA